MSPRCQNCGGHVSEDYVRVFSADDETIRACPDCDNVRSMGEVRQMRTPSGRANDPAKSDDPERDISDLND